jgi:hypothetical protein
MFPLEGNSALSGRSRAVVIGVPPGRRGLDGITGKKQEKRRQCGTPSTMAESLIGSQSRFLGLHVRYVANTLD